MNAANVHRHVSATAVEYMRCPVRFVSGARLATYLPHGKKVVYWGEAPLAGAPDCYSGRCWFESNRPSHSAGVAQW